jgi:hypothetical protein
MDGQNGSAGYRFTLSPVKDFIQRDRQRERGEG